MAEAAGLPLTEPGLWVERTSATAFRPGLPALFLDRDGTLNVDTGYVGDPAEVVMIEAIVPVVAASNRAGLPVIVVTNQSGIARGYYGWPEFSAVNRRVLDLLAEAGGAVDMVLACAYHDAGPPPLGIRDHPMRKPNPGMLLHAGKELGLDMPRSLIVGDRAGDMEAGWRAGLRQGWLIGGGKATLDAFTTHPLDRLEDFSALTEAVRRLG